MCALIVVSSKLHYSMFCYMEILLTRYLYYARIVLAIVVWFSLVSRLHSPAFYRTRIPQLKSWGVEPGNEASLV